MGGLSRGSRCLPFLFGKTGCRGANPSATQSEVLSESQGGTGKQEGGASTSVYRSAKKRECQRRLYERENLIKMARAGVTSYHQNDPQYVGKLMAGKTVINLSVVRGFGRKGSVKKNHSPASA